MSCDVQSGHNFSDIAKIFQNIFDKKHVELILVQHILVCSANSGAYRGKWKYVTVDKLQNGHHIFHVGGNHSKPTLQSHFSKNQVLETLFFLKLFL